MTSFIVFILGGLLTFALWAIIISAVLSWLIAFNVINTYNRGVYTIVRTLDSLTGPILEPFRRIIPSLGGIDISPIFAILIIQGMRDFLLPMAANALRQVIG
ncbi:MAG: hypothetical protein B7Z26_01505 [Asticcacaulis sp. 32-58-5]|nr:MAG: hypothetical protein B7Z26_01505 [Asticcacaulis sp. 32-58-5]